MGTPSGIVTKPQADGIGPNLARGPDPTGRPSISHTKVLHFRVFPVDAKSSFFRETEFIGLAARAIYFQLEISGH